MPNSIAAAHVFILNGILTGTIRFVPGLNIISGENGTLKTKLLQAVKTATVINEELPPTTRFSANHVVRSVPTAFINIAAISPKRNTERRNYEAIITWNRQQNRNLETIIGERINAAINESGFDIYPAPGDAFYTLWEQRRRDGGNAIEWMEKVSAEFTSVIRCVFPQHAWSSRWDSNLGQPAISLLKNGKEEVPINELSTGEQEVLSLILFLYISKGAFDVYLIDEPEVHLNWNLELNLFAFLRDFCAEHEKQIIVATHSRAIFTPGFLERTQFLSWNEAGNIVVGKELTDEQRSRLAGEVINIVKMGEFTRPTFFVEDESQVKVVNALARIIGVPVSTDECGSSSNVMSLFRLSQLDGGWENSYFVRDGDNEGNPFPGKRDFIHLDKYCIENYLLDLDIAAEISGKTKEQVAEIVFNLIKESRDKVIAKTKTKYFAFLFDKLQVTDITADFLQSFDASVIFKKFHTQLGLTQKTYLDNYITAANQQGRLAEICPRRIVEVLQDAKAKQASLLAFGESQAAKPEIDEVAEATNNPA
jgi:hypothetical protein